MQTNALILNESQLTFAIHLKGSFVSAGAVVLFLLTQLTQLTHTNIHTIFKSGTIHFPQTLSKALKR